MTIRLVRGAGQCSKIHGIMTAQSKKSIRFTSSIGTVEKVLLTGGLVSGGLLGGAHIFEALGYTPCALCLDQREALWTALAITVIGFIISVVMKARLLGAAAVGTAALVYLFGAGLAFYHTGIEFGLWPGPASCSGGTTITTIEDLQKSIASDKPVIACDRAAWSYLGISMAGYNLLASAGLACLMIITTLNVLRNRKPQASI